MQWIKTFYTDISSCVLNNGFTTDLFPVRLGVRHGDSLSSLLFILALEVLVCQIRNDQSVKGIIVKDEETKLALVADDMPCFLRELRSYHQLCVILHLFSKYSGLRVNNDKTDILAVGPHRVDEASFSHKICTPIKILGIVFDYRIPSRTKANFDFIFKSIQERLNMWKWRGLTLIGKLKSLNFLLYPNV